MILPSWWFDCDCGVFDCDCGVFDCDCGVFDCGFPSTKAPKAHDWQTNPSWEAGGWTT